MTACLHCGVAFLPKPRSKGRFCTRACWRAYESAQRPTAQCHECGKTFCPHSGNIAKGDGRYCSRACSAAAHGKMALARIEQRFWSFVEKTDGCWLWTGSRDANGYGRLMMPVRLTCTLSHRLSYEINCGPIPEGMSVLHRCDNPPCCNPDHLFLGTRADNNADKTAKGRQAKGERIANAKLTEAQVVEIRRLAEREGANLSAIGKVYGVSRTTVRDIRDRLVWSHVTDQSEQ